MGIELVKIDEQEKSILAKLLEKYEIELKNISGLDIGEYGGYKYLDSYWTDKDRYPFFIKVNGKLAGFVLVNKHTYISNDAHSIAEFYVLKEYRANGVGNTVAKRIFQMFPGNWEVAQLDKNEVAKKFWRNVVNEFTNGNFKETILHNEKWNGPVLSFKS